MEAGGRTTSKYYEALAQQRGVDVSALRPYLEQLEQVKARQEQASGALASGAVQLDKYGLSAKQTAAAMRGVPAQLTDIFVSLQGGQAPITVLLQQGGQLKDMFGGVVPAAKALGSAVLGMVNPFTIAAAAATGLFIVYQKGATELEQFNKNAIMTGNIVGLTGNQVAMLASRMDALAGVTRSGAVKALTEVAASGKISADQMERVAEVSIRSAQILGRETKDVVSEFAKLADEPSRAAAALNEKYNYLTAEVYRQILALEEQGKVQDAVRLSQETWAEASIQRLGQVEEKLSALGRAWAFVKQKASEAWDEMGGTDELKTIDVQLEQARSQSMYFRNPVKEKELEERRKQVLEERRLESEAAAAAAETQRIENERIIKLNEANEGWKRQNDSLKTRIELRNEEISNARKWAAELGKSEQELAQAIDRINKKYEEKPKSSGIRTTDTELARLRASIQAEEARAQALMASGSAYSKLNEFEALAIQYAEKIKLATNAATKSQLERNKALAEQAGAAKRANDELDRQLKSQAQTTDSVRKQNQSLKDQIETYGMGKSAIEEMIIARLEERLAIEESKPGNDAVVAGIREEIAARRELMGNMRTKEALDLQLKEWEQWEKDVGQIFQQVSQSLTDAIFEGGKSGRDLVKDLFKTLTLRVLINPVMNSIQGAVTNSLGGMFGYQNPQQQGGVDAMGLARGAKGLYDSYSTGSYGVTDMLYSAGEKMGSYAVQNFAAGMAGYMPSAIGSGVAASLGSGAAGTLMTSMPAGATTTFSASLGSSGASSM
ncbi:MAG: hypothetical protein GX086_13700, partial [Alcaligenaceae bacterium]|nr:hypothetical protein [Alcaligenaceae bacterium]